MLIENFTCDLVGVLAECEKEMNGADMLVSQPVCLLGGRLKNLLRCLAEWNLDRCRNFLSAAETLFHCLANGHKFDFAPNEHSCESTVRLIALRRGAAKQAEENVHRFNVRAATLRSLVAP